jgi:hypothetical protein
MYDGSNSVLSPLLRALSQSAKPYYGTLDPMPSNPAVPSPALQFALKPPDVQLRFSNHAMPHACTPGARHREAKAGPFERADDAVGGFVGAMRSVGCRG